MYACLYWIDDNGFNHVMRGYPHDLIPHAEELTEIKFPWKLETFDYTLETMEEEE